MGIKKMNYCGKYMEDFAYSFCSFLEINGGNIAELPDIDCLSLRSMFFSLGCDISKWFRTAITWQEYMTHIKLNMGYRESLCIETAKEYADNIERIYDWVFLGDVPAYYPIDIVQEKFYNRTVVNYLFKNMGSYFIISDALGSPYRIIQRKEFKSYLENNNGFVAFFKDKPKQKIASAQNIVLLARQYIQKHPEYLLKNQEMYFRNYYYGGVREQISLRYGLMNYQLQMNKTIRYFSDAGLLCDSTRREIESKLIATTSVIDSLDYSIISEIEDLLWNSLEGGVLCDEYS